MSFSYRLAVLTHGDALPLKATLESFEEMVSPLPSSVRIVWDGPTTFGRSRDHAWPDWLRNIEDGEITARDASGFCGATSLLWEQCCERPQSDYVFWLEHDFEFERHIDLRRLALALIQNPMVAQMSLLRHPEQHELPSLVDETWVRHPSWLEQSTYWTTNPALIPIEVMRDNPWAEGPSCEGRMTIRLREAGYTFGVWGDGTPQIKHTGVRTGHGY